jgi:N-acetylglucosamine-6-phosphate deacetylase
LVGIAVMCATGVSQVCGQSVSTRPLDGLSDEVPNNYALVGATLVVDAQTTIDKGTLIVRNGKLHAVGAVDALPSDLRILDLSGKTIYPGFIDAYSETELDAPNGGAPHWNSGVTPQASVSQEFKPAESEMATLRKLGIVARLVAPASGQIKGTSAVISTAAPRGGMLVLRDTAGLHITLTTSRSREQFPGSPMGAVALARQTLLDARWYRDVWRAHDGDPRLPEPEQNDALARLMQLEDARVPVIIDAADERSVLRADRFAREFGLNAIIRGSGREYRRLDAIAETNRAILLPVHYSKAPDVSSAEAARRVTLERLMHWDLAPENAARLARAGATIALTTDRLPDKSKWLEALRKTVTRGLEPDEALRAITETPARLFGLEDQLGTLAVGKRASFVVTDGPLFDTKTKLLETWVDGERSEWAAEPLIDPRGKWQWEVKDSQGNSQQVDVWIIGKPEKLAGRLSAGETEAKIKSASLQNGRLILVMPGKVLGSDKELHSTWIATSHEQDNVTWLGKVAWLDGTTTDSIARRVEKYSDQLEQELQKTATESKQAEDPAESQQPGTEETAEAEQGREEAEPQDASLGGEGDADKHDQKNEDEPDDKQEVKRALFDVTYPLGAFGQDSIPERPEAVAFVHATVWTSDETGRIADGTVLIEQGKITAVGNDVPIPDGAIVIDATGKHITPGIIDCHSHIATDGGVNESTQAITAEVRIGDFIDPDHIAVYRQLAGGVTTSNILHGSANPIGGQNQVIKLRWGALPEEAKFQDAPAGIKFALGENVKQANWGDRYTTRYPQTRMGVDEIIDDAFQRAREYNAQWNRWRNGRQGLPPRTDLELEALAEVLRGQRWIHCHSYRQSEILAFMKTCDKYQVRIGSLQHILEGYKLADEMARRNITGSSFSDWWAYKYEVFDAIPYNGALMHEAGVIVSFNSDDAELGRRLNLEAAKAMKYGGVSEDEALKFVTLNPAKQLRIDHRVGSIRPGKDADLVVWSHSPLSIYTRCEQTWIDGRLYFDLDEDQAARARDTQRHAQLVQRIIASEAEMLKPGETDDSELVAWPRSDLFCHHSHDGEEEDHSEEHLETHDHQEAR